MPKKLFVGGLSWGTREEVLRDEFAQFGEIQEVKIVMDQVTGRSRGFGFITFANDEEAERAMSQMNGVELDGRTLRVNYAEERSRGGNRFHQGGGGGRGGRGGDRGGRQRRW